MPKRKIVVLSDSACDLPLDLARKNHVDILNFTITVDGKSYNEREDFTFDEYYDLLRTCEGIPVTAHITMPRFLEFFEQCAAEGTEQVLYVPICGSGSNTYNAASMARDEFCKTNPQSPMKIHIVDSHTYSMAYGWFVAEAARKLNNGAEMAVVIEWLEDIFSRVEILLASYTLKFMKKSGRISAAAAFAGELLGLRPVVSLIDGESKVLKKVRGDKDVWPAIMEIAEQRMDESGQYWIGGTTDESLREAGEACAKRWKVKPTLCFKLGAAVTTNTGPDCIAIVYLGEKRR